MVTTLLFLYVIFIPLLESSRITERIILPNSSPGCDRSLVVHKWGPAGTRRVYIQASLHADEIPGILVSNKLVALLDQADSEGHILNEIVLVPFANPIGLDQQLLGSHVGRFSLSTGINFNREIPNVNRAVLKNIESKLSMDPDENVKVIRGEMMSQLNIIKSNNIEAILKRELLKLAISADVVLDLHCDNDAILHMYTHDRLWPALRDFASILGTQCQLTSPDAGGYSFDEACSCPWAYFADEFPEYPIPIACQSITLELRGELDVSIN